MDRLEIANNLTLAMIEKHGVTLFASCDEKDQVQVAEANAKAVAAAFEVIYAGVLETFNKTR